MNLWGMFFCFVVIPSCMMAAALYAYYEDKQIKNRNKKVVAAYENR